MSLDFDEFCNLWNECRPTCIIPDGKEINGDIGFVGYDLRHFMHMFDFLVQESYINQKDNFFELGSAMGRNVTIMANLGLNAYGVEINSDFSKASSITLDALKKCGAFPGNINCRTVNGSYYLEDYILMREQGKSSALEYEKKKGYLDAKGGNFFPIFTDDVYKRLGKDFEDMDVMWFYAWQLQIPSVLEMFDLFAKDTAQLIIANDQSSDNLISVLGLNLRKSDLNQVIPKKIKNYLKNGTFEYSFYAGSASIFKYIKE